MMGVQSPRPAVTGSGTRIDDWPLCGSTSTA
jgi:hypothetical protein